MAASSPSKTRAGPSKWSKSIPATFTTEPFGASEPRRIASPPIVVDRVVEGVHHLAVGAGRGDERQVLAHRAARDGDLVGVQEALVGQHGHDHGDAADAVDVQHVVRAVGLGVGQVGHPGRHLVEVLELQVDLGLGGDGQQVQHGVGGAAEGHDHGDGVLERPLGDDVAGPDALAEQVEHGHAGGVGVVVAAAVDRRGGRRAGQGQAEGLTDRRHGVGGEHARAGPDGGARPVLDGVEFLVVDGAGGMGPDGLEHRDDVEDLPVVVARQLGAAVEEDRRQVEAGRGHHHPRQGLVAAGEGDHGVEALGVHHGLDRVGDHLAADQAGPHPLVAHRDAVADGDRVELDRDSPRPPARPAWHARPGGPGACCRG